MIGLPDRTFLNEGLEKVSRYRFTCRTFLNEGLERVSRYRFTWYDVLE